ncbi:riboflavin kinase, partial [Pseudomonas aeruginosa]
VELNGVGVSSTRGRQALSDGVMQLTERLLGLPFSLRGRVMDGQKHGRQLGSPTGNMHLQRCKALVNVVYVVSTMVDGQPG